MDKVQERIAELDSDEEDDDIFSSLQGKSWNKKYPFKKSHPGYHFSQLVQLKLPVIPKISLPRGKLPDIALLKMNDSEVDEAVSERREYYAKMALLMFYPFRTAEDLMINDSYWEKFRHELQLHLQHRKENSINNYPKIKLPIAKFWPKGFEILQNMQDRLTLEKHLKRAKDPILLQTKCTEPESSDNKKERNDGPLLPDITEFLTELP